jgi:hypothetical protein
MAVSTVFLLAWPAGAASTDRLSTPLQAGRASPDQVFEAQSVGCLVAGIATTTLAAATGTAATMVTGGVALPLAGEVVASFVTYFTAGCAVGAIIAPGLPLIERRMIDLADWAYDRWIR